MHTDPYVIRSRTGRATVLPVVLPHVPELDELPAEGQRWLLNHHHFLVDALGEAIKLLYGREPVTNWTDDGHNWWGLVMTAEGDTCYWSWIDMVSVQQGWERSGPVVGVGPGDPWALSRAYLKQSLTRLAASGAPIDEMLTQSEWDTPSARTFGCAVAGMWWQNRLDKGFTTDAARMMLGLLLPSTALGLLTFPADGSAPTLPTPPAPPVAAKSAGRITAAFAGAKRSLRRWRVDG